MLSPAEFTVGSLVDATPLCLLLPRTKYEQPMLVTQDGERRMAVFLGEEHRLESFECSTAENWKGLLVPDIRIELDESSVFDPETEYVPSGAMIRLDDRLALAVKGRDPHGFSHQQRVTIVPDLPALKEGHRAGFRSWQIVIGEKETKRVLHSVKVKAIDAPER